MNWSVLIGGFDHYVIFVLVHMIGRRTQRFRIFSCRDQMKFSIAQNRSVEAESQEFPTLFTSRLCRGAGALRRALEAMYLCRPVLPVPMEIGGTLLRLLRLLRPQQPLSQTLIQRTFMLHNAFACQASLSLPPYQGSAEVTLTATDGQNTKRAEGTRDRESSGRCAGGMRRRVS